MSSSWQLIATIDGRHLFTVYIPRDPGLPEGPITKEQANAYLNPPRNGKSTNWVKGPAQYSLKAPTA